ncbi:Carboxymuconolactone decarboxylase [Mycena kentingensis (nom. inval.)]|nr:Carboxymuconolactone decarboxylase [Mycena kentingensis (nom. inval.)]
MGKSAAPKTEPKYGKIPGVDDGAWFEDRDGLLASGVHTAPQAGICYSERFGAYSVLLNGGYEDDVDEGNRIVYTGQGKGDVFGKNGSAKGVQQGDQSWTRGNLGLKRSLQDGRSVRVIRGSQGGSRFAPESGFRYDGLYKVTYVCREKGREGYWVCRFKMQRESDQPPIPTRAIAAPMTPKKKRKDGVRRPIPIPRPSTPVASSSKRRLEHDSARVHERVYARSMGLQPPYIHSPSPAPSPPRRRELPREDAVQSSVAQRTGEPTRRASASDASTSSGPTPSSSSRPMPQVNAGTPLREASGSSPTVPASAAPTSTGPTHSSLSTRVSQSRETLLRTASISATSTSAASTTPTPSSSIPKSEIIDLTLDEDENDAPAPPPRTAPSGPPSGTKRAFIDLTMDDSDSDAEDEAPRRAKQRRSRPRYLPESEPESCRDSDLEDDAPRRPKHRRPRVRYLSDSEQESCPSSPGPSALQLQKLRREEGSGKAENKESGMAPR